MRAYVCVCVWVCVIATYQYSLALPSLCLAHARLSTVLHAPLPRPRGRVWFPGNNRSGLNAHALNRWAEQSRDSAVNTLYVFEAMARVALLLWLVFASLLADTAFSLNNGLALTPPSKLASFVGGSRDLSCTHSGVAVVGEIPLQHRLHQ